MKYFCAISFFVLLNGIICPCYSQKYIVIDLDSSYINEVVLGHGSTAFPNSKIYLYNIWDNYKLGNATYLITASILPDLSKGEIKWDTLSQIPKQYKTVGITELAIKTITQYYNNCRTILQNDNYPLRTTAYTPVIKKQNKYLIAAKNPCLIEFYKYYAQGQPSRLTEYDYVSIYPNGVPYSRNDIAKIKTYLTSNFHGDIDYLGKVLPSANPVLVHGKKEFQFWITPPPMLDAGWEMYGIENFALIPNIGIVAGSFNQYFKGSSVINSKINHFENNTTLFKAQTINGISFLQYLAKKEK